MAALIETEYLTQNGLIAYPFIDGCSAFVSDFLLDASITLKHPNGYAAYISAYQNNVTNSLVEFQLTVVDVAGNSLFTEVLNFAWAVLINKNTIFYDSINVAVKFVVGKSLEAEKNNSSSVFHSYARKDAEFTTSTINRATPVVTSITYSNKKNMNEDAEFVFSTTQTANISEGTNLSFSLLGNISSVGVVPRAGTGLYNPCGDDVTNVIKTINNIKPNSLGNFFFSTDDCYTTAPLINGLMIDNICAPKCEPEHITNFAHYLNRVKSAILSVGRHVEDISTTIRYQINNYYTVTLPAINSPNFTVKISRSALPLNNYHSVLVSLINPTEASVNYTITITTTAELNGNASVEVDGVSNVITLPFTGDVPCRDKADVYFVLKVPNNNTRSLHIDVPNFRAATAVDFSLS